VLFLLQKLQRIWRGRFASNLHQTMVLLGKVAIVISAFSLVTAWLIFELWQIRPDLHSVSFAQSVTPWISAERSVELKSCDNSWASGTQFTTPAGAAFAIDSTGVLCDVEALSPLTSCCRLANALLGGPCASQQECECLHSCIKPGTAAPSALERLPILMLDDQPGSISAFENCLLQCRLLSPSER